MAALGLNMKGRGEKKREPTSKAKKKAVKKVVAKKVTAKAVKDKKPAKSKSAKKSETVKSTPNKKVAAKTTAPRKQVVKKSSIKNPKVKKTEAKTVETKSIEPQIDKVAASTQTDNSTTSKSGPELKLRNATLIVEPSKRRKIRKTKVIMEGDLNINNVDAFIEQVKPLFEDYDFIDFFLREATSLDLSHLQMLYYFQNHFAKKGKTVTVDANLSPDFKKIIISNGFKEFMFIPKLV